MRKFGKILHIFELRNDVLDAIINVYDCVLK